MDFAQGSPGDAMINLSDAVLMADGVIHRLQRRAETGVR